MITKLSLTNFKSWREIRDMRLAPITGLFGTNSSGKTSILQLLLMLKRTTESPDRFQPLELGIQPGLVDLGTFKDVIHAHNTNTVLDWTLEWSLDKPHRILDAEGDPHKVLFQGQDLGFSCAIDLGEGNGMHVRRFSYEFDQCQFAYESITGKNSEYRLNLRNEGSRFKFKRYKGRAWNLPKPVKCYGYPNETYGYFQNAGFLSDFQLYLVKLFERVFYLGPLRAYPVRQYVWGGAQPADMGPSGEHVIAAILSSRERGVTISRGKGKPKTTVEQYVAEWLKTLGLIHDFQVTLLSEGSNLYQVQVRKTEASSPVLITDVGFGISQLLPVITLCYYVPEGSTILLEQPEIHLHPSVQAGLADVLIDAMRVRKIQIIVESHSEHLLRRIQRRIAEGKELFDEDVALYFCRFDGDHSVLDPLELDVYGNIRNWPKDFFGNEFEEMAQTTMAAMRRKMNKASKP